MEIEFHTRHLELCYNDFREGSREWGAAVARRYINRVDRIRSIDSFRNLYADRPMRIHALHGQQAGKFAITLIGRYRLIVTRGDSPDQLIIYEVTSHYDD